VSTKADREVLNIVVVGHVDHGKSTVIGRLLFDTHSLPNGAVEKVKRIAREKGKPFEYAYLLDAFEEEQKQGITIDTTQLQFRTAARDYVIIDAPGHKEFLKNMISGAANAEAALLIIDANEGIQEQSRRHGYILSLLGIQKVYVLVNKMDLIDYSAEKFNYIRQEMNAFLHDLQVYPLKYIPISGFYGENITVLSDKMPWYQGQPLLKAIDLFEKDNSLEGKPLRFPIQDVYKFDHRRIIAGRIEAGTLQVGDKILISPSQKVTTVKSIEHWVDKDKQDKVTAGMSVGITVADEFFNQRGEFISHLENPPLVTDTFKVNLFWLGKKELVKHKEYILKLATQEVSCEIVDITQVIDATTLASIEQAKQVKLNDVAEVIIKTKQKICLDAFKNNQHTGRFVIVDGYDVCGGGIVSGLAEQIQSKSTLNDQEKHIEISCFDEYYYVLAENTVKKVFGKLRAFKTDDILPVTGQTYEYPTDFSIIDLQHKWIAWVKNAKLRKIVDLAAYRYLGETLIETSGAGIKVQSETEFQKFIQALDSIETGVVNAKFSNQWLQFGKFKTVRYIENLTAENLEYYI